MLHMLGGGGIWDVYLTGETWLTWSGTEEGEADVVAAPGHPLVRNVPTRLDDCATSRSYFVEYPFEDAAVVTTYDGADPTTVVYPFGEGLVVAPAMPWEQLHADESCEAEPMLMNALRFVLEAAVPWLSLAPREGTVAPGDSMEVAVRYAAGELPVGTYEAEVHLSTNVPGEQPAVHVVTLQVTDDVAVEPEAGLPERFALHPAYPNPFNPRTTVPYDVPQPGRVVLTVYDVLGREVARLVDEEQPAGRYELSFDAQRMASGTYYVRMQAGDYVQVRSLVLLK